MNQWTIDFIAGSISGMLGTFVGHPLDTVKCRLQAMSNQYGNTFKSIVKILKEEKFIGLYKGVVPPMLNQFPINAITFSEYYRMHRVLDKNTNLSKGSKYFWGGVYSGIVYIIVNTPAELVKCRQQMNVERYLSIKEVSLNIIRKEGILGFYRGFVVSFHRDVFSGGLYFYIYYKLKDYWAEKGSLTQFKLMFAGGVSGVVTWFSTYPFDTLKTIIQINKNSKTLSIIDAYKIHCKETNTRIMGLYKGVMPTLVRGFYSNAVIFYTNEVCHTILEME